MVSDAQDFEKRRKRMVDTQIASRDIDSELVLDAMGAVPREKFVPKDYRAMAYHDRPLPIGQGQTISQPYVVALMTDALKVDGDDKVLEIGTGSGYGAGVLSRVAGEVYTVERHEDLAERAQEIFDELGYDNAHVIHADGSKGLPEEAPFDGIVGTAAGPHVPETFKEQLAIGGHLVMPVGEKLGGQTLVRVTKVGDEEFETEDLGFVRFVPMIGQEGFGNNDRSGPAMPRSNDPLHL